MTIKQGWLLTANGGSSWYIGQDPKVGKFYKTFTAQNYQEAVAIATQIIKDFENVIQRPPPEL